MVKNRYCKEITWERNAIAGLAIGEIITKLPVDLLAPGLKIAGKFLFPPWVNFLMTWFFLSALTYISLPIVFGLFSPPFPINNDKLKRLLVLLIICLGIFLNKGDISIESPERVILVMTIPFLYGFIVLNYLVLNNNWDIINRTGKIVDFGRQLPTTDSGVAEYNSDIDLVYGRTDIRGQLYRRLYPFLFISIIGLFLLLSAIFCHILTFMYPIPEVVIIISYIGICFQNNYDNSLQKSVFRSGIEIEEILFKQLKNSTKGSKSLIATICIIFGMLFSGYTLSMVLLIAPRFYQWVSLTAQSIQYNITLEEYLLIFNFFGSILLIFGSGIYNFWIWAIEWMRLPYLFSPSSTVFNRRNQPPRVFGFNILPSGGIALGLSYTMSDFWKQITELLVLFGLLWPLLILSYILVIIFTYMRKSTSNDYEFYIIVGGFWLYGSLLFGVMELPELLSVYPNVKQMASILNFEIFFIYILFMLIMFPIGVDWGRHRYNSKYSSLISFSLIGIVGFAASYVFSGKYVMFYRLMGVIFTSSGTILGVTEYYYS